MESKIVKQSKEQFCFLPFLRDLPDHVAQSILLLSLTLENYSTFRLLVERGSTILGENRSTFLSFLINNPKTLHQLQFIDFHEDGINILHFGAILNRLRWGNNLLISQKWRYLKHLLKNSSKRRIIRLCNLLGQSGSIRDQITIVFEVNQLYLNEPERFDMITLKCQGACRVPSVPVILPCTRRLENWKLI